MQSTIYFYFGILLSIIFFSLPILGKAQVNYKDSSISTSTVTILSNKDRVSFGLVELKYNKKLEKAAQLKAEDMVRDEYFAHVSTDGKNPWYWFKQVGYRFKAAGENLAVLFTNPADIESAWMNSTSHRENILDGDYSDIGVGIATGTRNGIETNFVVELFGKESK